MIRRKPHGLATLRKITRRLSGKGEQPLDINLEVQQVVSA